MTGLWLVSYIALWILFLILAVVLLSVLRNLGTLYESLAVAHPLEEQPIKLVAGEALPDLTMRTLSGERVPVSRFQGTKTAFFVVSPGCSSCTSLLKDIAENGADPYPHDGIVRQRVIVSNADTAETAALIDQTGLPDSVPLLIDPDGGTRREWGVAGTPTTVIVDEQLRFVRHEVGYAEKPARRSTAVARE
jgi:peroxiredoxin